MNLMPVQGYSDFKYAGKWSRHMAITRLQLSGINLSDSDNYRVIYADLSVKEMPADQLPKLNRKFLLHLIQTRLFVGSFFVFKHTS